MKLGMGVLRWRPADFWAATPHELMVAINGHLEGKGAETPEQVRQKQREFDEFAAEIEAAESAREKI